MAGITVAGRVPSLALRRSALAMGDLLLFAAAEQGSVDLCPGLAAGRVDPQPVPAGFRDHRLDLPRRRRGAALLHLAISARAEPPAETEPPQVYGSKPIEVAWTVAPALIVFILVLVTTRTLWEVERPQPEPAAGRSAAVRHRHRPAVVVGICLRALRRPQAGFHHRQRVARAGQRPTGTAAARLSDARSRPTSAIAFGCRGWPARPT